MNISNLQAKGKKTSLVLLYLTSSANTLTHWNKSN